MVRSYPLDAFAFSPHNTKRHAITKQFCSKTRDSKLRRGYTRQPATNNPLGIVSTCRCLCKREENDDRSRGVSKVASYRVTKVDDHC